MYLVQLVNFINAGAGNFWWAVQPVEGSIGWPSSGFHFEVPHCVNLSRDLDRTDDNGPDRRHPRIRSDKPAAMKLDTRAMRHLTAEDWRVLTAVCVLIKATDRHDASFHTPPSLTSRTLRFPHR